MKRNMGLLDRIIRILIAAAIAVLSVTGAISGALNTVLVIVAVVLLLTSLFGVCPAYLLLRISTTKRKSA
jgi:hypothetical protein